MMIKQKIIEHHGRVENIQLFDKDPTLFKKEAEEKAKQKAIADEAKAKKNLGKEIEEGKDEKDKNEAEGEKVIDWRTLFKEFSNSSTTLYEIFGEYGVEMKKELEENETEEAKKSHGTIFYDFTP